MKKTITTFIIGFLIGAIVATSGFYAYVKLSGSNGNQQAPSMQGQPPEMQDGDNAGQPPEKPEGDDSGQPPAKPDGDNTNNSSSGGQES